MFVSLKLAYNRQLVISMTDSSHQIYLTAQGEGADPQLEFCPSELALGPCLPNSTHTEAEVTVKNPCSFPIEFYSLEFDTQYLEEEKVDLMNWHSSIILYLSENKKQDHTQHPNLKCWGYSAYI